MKPIAIIFKPSHQLFLLIATMGICASGLILVLTWSWPIKLLLIVSIAITASLSVAQYALRLLPWSVLSLNINLKHEVQLMQRDGTQLANISLHQESIVTEHLAILRYHTPDQTWWQCILTPSLVILPDMLPADDFRRLRVWLRWKANSTNIIKT